MASNEKTTLSVITLTAQAAKQLAKVLRTPSTDEQKQSIHKSVGIYSLYQKKWQKKIR